MPLFACIISTSFFQLNSNFNLQAFLVIIINSDALDCSETFNVSSSTNAFSARYDQPRPLIPTKLDAQFINDNSNIFTGSGQWKHEQSIMVLRSDIGFTQNTVRCFRHFELHQGST